METAADFIVHYSRRGGGSWEVSWEFIKGKLRQLLANVGKMVVYGLSGFVTGEVVHTREGGGLVFKAT